jgi:hypothetical protein
MLAGGFLTEEETCANYGVNVCPPRRSLRRDIEIIGEERVIDSYTFGLMVVDGRGYRSDIIILPHVIVSDWRRQDGHLLQLADIEQYLEALPNLAIVGTGSFGMMRVAEDLEEALRLQAVTMIVERTGKAWKTFNRYLKGGELVAGAFHLTC